MSRVPPAPLPAMVLSIVALLAAPAALAAPPHRCAVDVDVHGQDDPLLFAAIREIVERNHLLVRSSSHRIPPASGSCEPLANVRILLGPTSVEVDVVDTDSGTVYARRTLRRDPSLEIMREEVALAVQSAIDALLERRPTPDPEPVPEEPESTPLADPAPKAEPEPGPKPAPTVRETDREPQSAEPWSFGAGVYGFGRAFAADHGVSPGVGALGYYAPVDRGLRPTVWLLAAYQPSITASRDGVDVEVWTGSFRLLPTVSLYAGRSFRLDAGAGAGLDVLSVKSQSQSQLAHTGPDRTDVVPVATLLVAARFPVYGSASLFAAASGDLDFAPNRYVVADPSGREPVFGLRALRVGGMVGITLRAGGGEKP